jgi:hypothetical protein
MRPSFTMAIEALGTLVEDKTWLTAVSIFAFASGESGDCARAAMGSSTSANKRSSFGMLV